MTGIKVLLKSKGFKATFNILYRPHVQKIKLHLYINKSNEERDEKRKDEMLFSFHFIC